MVSCNQRRAERDRLKSDKNVKFKDERSVDKNCPSCGHKHMWESRSETGQGFYIYKCTKCGFMVK